MLSYVTLLRCVLRPSLQYLISSCPLVDIIFLTPSLGRDVEVLLITIEIYYSLWHKETLDYTSLIVRSTIIPQSPGRQVKYDISVFFFSLFMNFFSIKNSLKPRMQSRLGSSWGFSDGGKRSGCNEGKLLIIHKIP